MKRAIERNVGNEISFDIGMKDCNQPMMGKIIRLRGDDEVRLRYRRKDGSVRYEWWPDAMICNARKLTPEMREYIMGLERENIRRMKKQRK